MMRFRSYDDNDNVDDIKSVQWSYFGPLRLACSNDVVK